MRNPVDRASVESFLRSHERIEEPHLLEDGQEVGEWVVRAFLGKGGSGEVYRVEHRYLHIGAAIKVLSRDDSTAKERFGREAQIISTAQNPALPKFYSFGEVGGRPYLVIELLEHYPLPETDREIAKYLLKVCEGVACLHRHGLVHRDIKPQNVLCRPNSNQPVLIDLGLVKDVALAPAHEGISLSIVNGKAVGVGTPKYAAPEQFAGGEIAPCADIHALGMLANECFSGKPPRSWARIIRRSTSSIPSQRYSTVVEFARAIRYRHAYQGYVTVLYPLLIGLLLLLWGLATEVASASRKFELTSDHPKLATNPLEVVGDKTNRLSRAERSVEVSSIKTNDEINASHEVGGFRGGRRTVMESDDGRLKPGVRFIPNFERED